MNTIVCADPLDRPYFFHSAPGVGKKLPELLSSAGQSIVVRENMDSHQVLVKTKFTYPVQVLFWNEVEERKKREIGIRIDSLTFACTCLRDPGMLLVQLERPLKGNDTEATFWITLGLKSCCGNEKFFDVLLEKSVREFAVAMTYPWAYTQRLKSLSLAVR